MFIFQFVPSLFHRPRLFLTASTRLLSMAASDEHQSLRAYFISLDEPVSEQVSNKDPETTGSMATTRRRIRFDFPVLTSKLLPDTKSWSVGPNRMICLNRDETDTLKTFFERLRLNFDQKFSKKSQTIAKRDVKGLRPRHSIKILDARLVDETNSTMLPLHTTLGQLLCKPALNLTLQMSFVAEEKNAAGDVIQDRVSTCTYPVQLNPARLIKFFIEMTPIVGCPLMPCIEADNFSYQHSHFHWYVSEHQFEGSQSLIWPRQPTARGLIFYPREEHVGRLVRLIIRPHDESGSEGVLYCKPGQSLNLDEEWFQAGGDHYEHSQPIKACPSRKVLHSRLTTLNNFQNNNAVDETTKPVRVVTYNFLAAYYSRTKDARQKIFMHCPEAYLDMNYRLPLLLSELQLYKADLICLQEIDRHVFNHYLVHFARLEMGMLGDICYKRQGMTLLDREQQNDASHPAFDLPEPVKCCLDQEKPEGVAIFYRQTRFELVKLDKVTSLLERGTHMLEEDREELQANFGPDTEIYHDLQRLDQMMRVSSHTKPSHEYSVDHVAWYRERAMCHAMCAMLLRDKWHTHQHGFDRFLAVGSTHLFFHAKADFWRNVQALICKISLNLLALSVAKRDGPMIPVLLGADLNSNPMSPALETLVGATLLSPAERALERRSGGLHFHSAYHLNNSEAITNWVPTFSCMLDYILYGKVSIVTGANTRRHGRIECTSVSPLSSKMDIVSMCLESDSLGHTDHRSCDNLLASVDIPFEDKFSLPNAHQPSDHLSLAADFVFQYYHQNEKKKL